MPEEADERPNWITISRETTFITQPLDKDGCVDYFAAFNAKAGEGVTMDNNAAVLFVRAGGIPDLSQGNQDLYCTMLGIEPLAEQGPYFNDLDSSDETLKSDLNRAMIEPWSVDTFPLLAAWLTSNHESLELMIEGTRRPRCYTPWIPAEGSKRLIDAFLPVAQRSRPLARAIVARAMLRVNEGRIDEAQQDLLACHRLARLIGSSGTLIAGLVGFDIHRMAWFGDAAVMQYGQLSAASAFAYQRELRNLLAFPDMMDELDFTQRLILLDSASSIPLKLQTIGTGGINEPASEIIAKLTSMHDELMRVCNEGLDQFVAAGRLPTYSARDTATQGLVEEIRSVLAGIGNPVNPQDPQLQDFMASTIQKLKGRSPREAGHEIGRIYFSLLMPSTSGPIQAEARSRTREALGQLGFALAAFHAVHATYPETLDSLVPNEISHVPTDHYDQLPWRYVRSADGYLLYSVGANGVDDDGRTFNSDPNADDIILQIRGANQKTPLQ